MFEDGRGRGGKRRGGKRVKGEYVISRLLATFMFLLFLGVKKRLYKRLRRSVGPLVGRSVRPHNAITWKTSYVAIASRRGGGRGN